MTAYLLARWGETTTTHGLAVLAITVLQAAIGGQPPVAIASLAAYGILNIVLPEVK